MEKKMIIPSVVIVLAISTGALAIFSYQANTSLKQNESEMAALQVDLDALKQNMINIRLTSLEESSGGEQNINDIVTVVNPAVVRIDITRADAAGVGSGFIIDQNGYIITNRHVIEEAMLINVTLTSGETYTATVSDEDANRDIAILKLASSRTDFPVILLASASDTKVGDNLLVVGFPLGLALTGPPTFTHGIVSAIRTINGLGYIQTDASINPGNSGGPVLNEKGKLVGICVAEVYDPNINVQGMGLVIPVEDLLKFIVNGKVSCSGCHYDSGR